MTTGLGQYFTSPARRHARPEKKRYIAPLGQLSKRRRLQAELEDLLNDEFEDDVLPQLDGPSTTLEIEAEEPQPSLPNDNNESPRARRILPDDVAYSLYDKWKLVLPRLVDALLAFVSNSTGRVLSPPTTFQTTCTKPGCRRKTHKILCLFQDCK